MGFRETVNLTICHALAEYAGVVKLLYVERVEKFSHDLSIERLHGSGKSLIVPVRKNKWNISN